VELRPSNPLGLTPGGPVEKLRGSGRLRSRRRRGKQGGGRVTCRGVRVKSPARCRLESKVAARVAPRARGGATARLYGGLKAAERRVRGGMGLCSGGVAAQVGLGFGGAALGWIGCRAAAVGVKRSRGRDSWQGRRDGRAAGIAAGDRGEARPLRGGRGRPWRVGPARQ
jgi:hypothetical protein